MSIEKAHNDQVRAVDVSSVESSYFATGGDDYRVKIWDARAAAKPVATFAQHSHWIWSVQFDGSGARLLSASSDSLVNLWQCRSLMPGSKKKTIKLDRLFKSYSEHDESVYAVCWMRGVDAFLSLSHDGRCVINAV